MPKCLVVKWVVPQRKGLEGPIGIRERERVRRAIEVPSGGTELGLETRCFLSCSQKWKNTYSGIKQAAACR